MCSVPTSKAPETRLLAGGGGGGGGGGGPGFQSGRRAAVSVRQLVADVLWHGVSHGYVPQPSA